MVPALIPVTLTTLNDCLDAEFSWRRREISFLKSAFQVAKFDQRAAIGRACHVALYAHWEGFIRESAQHYLYHVSTRSLKFSQLRAGIFIAAYPNALAHLRDAGASAVQNRRAIALLEELRARRFRNLKPDVNTKSNLGFSVLEEIDCIIGDIGISGYVDKNILNVRLVEKRNKIAHGRDVGTDFEEFVDIVDRVTGWMQGIKDAIVNAAVTKQYELT